MKSEFSTKEPQAIYFPEEIRDFVKIKNLCIQDGVYYFIPQEHEMAECGAIVGMANTLKEARKQCLDRADMVKGDGIFFEKESFDRADKAIDQLAKFGIKIF
jgi:nucleoside 2-deoxyribosyltransferase